MSETFRNMGSSSYVRFLPIFTFIWLFLTFLLSYSMAVWDGHVYPWLPYISETGTLPPESCFFGQMLNIGAALTGIIVYFRYMQAELLIQSKSLGSLCFLLNKGCLFTGIIMALGYSLVANFQCTNVLTIHILGATMAFGIGIFYITLQTSLSMILNGQDRTGRRLNYVRIVLCILAVVFDVLMGIFAIKSMRYMIARSGRITEAMLYGPDKPTYNDRVVSTLSEWLLSGCFGFYILTFAYDFSYLYNSLTFMDSRLQPRARLDKRTVE